MINNHTDEAKKLNYFNKWTVLLLSLNIADILLTLFIGEFSGVKDYEGNPLGFAPTIILKIIFLPLTIYLCVKYNKMWVLKLVCAIYGLVILTWILIGVVYA